MPHLVLEYSDNVLEKEDLTSLFAKCHVLLAKTLPTEISSCKSRAIVCNTFYLAEGHEKNAFVHVTLKIMSGRSRETLNNTGHLLLDLLKSYFSESIRKLHLQISLEIDALPEAYFKA